MSKVIVLTHANLGRKLYCQPQLIPFWHWNEATKSTVIYASNNTMIPVSESPEDIMKLLQGEINVPAEETVRRPPSTFVNLKRVKKGEDSKGRETVTVCFGLTKNQEGVEVNTLLTLADAITALASEGKQANLTIHMEEKEAEGGRSFLSGFARVTEMIPRDAGGAGRTQFVPKASKSQAAKADADRIRQQFQNKG